jgi:hypothetical protein
LEKLEKASENPEIIPELEAEVKAGGKASLLSTDKVRFILIFPQFFRFDFRFKQFGLSLIALVLFRANFPQKVALNSNKAFFLCMILK